jgi:hypothetical protein
MNSKMIDFKIFCLESFKQTHKMNDEKAMNIFKQYNVFDYLNSFYDILHTIGQKHIVHDIDRYIDLRRDNSPK